jgi:hypothetical protein
VSKVNDAQNPVDHGVAKRNQRIDASQYQAIYQLLDKDIHNLALLRLSRKK